MIVIVAGMHRSGTSAIAGLLHNNGISMGRPEYFLWPSKENPRGFFEDIRFRQLNTTILSANDYNVTTFSPNVPPIIIVPCNDEMVRLVCQRNSEDRQWGWKDPRTCLTLHHWLPLLDNYDVRVIVPFRDFRSVAASMRARGNSVTDQQVSDLELRYQNCVYSALARSDRYIPVRAVNYDLLIEDPIREVASVSDFLDYPISDVSFIDPSLRRQHGQDHSYRTT